LRASERLRGLADRYYESTWSYASWLTGGAQDAEDLVHDAFLTAFDHLARKGEFAGDPGKWLRGVIRNLAHRWWRRKRRLPQATADHLKALAEEAEEPGTVLARTETEKALERCLEELGVRDRELVRRRYETDFDAGLLAKAMSMTSNALRVRLFRIRQKLKACVEARVPGIGGT
jgi:RNA polymerase sigma-70 factor (ECF subfamily)